jgi:hypothetical protein
VDVGLKGKFVLEFGSGIFGNAVEDASDRATVDADSFRKSTQPAASTCLINRRALTVGIRSRRTALVVGSCQRRRPRAQTCHGGAPGVSCVTGTPMCRATSRLAARPPGERYG